MRDLLDRRRRIVQKLPALEEILRGSVLVRTLRCGKPGCRCATGDGHPVTYLSVSFAGGRTEQICLPPSLVPLAKRWVANYVRWWEAVEKISEVNRQLLRRRRSAESAPRRGGRRGGSSRRR
jgi:hypothetical protein